MLAAVAVMMLAAAVSVGVLPLAVLQLVRVLCPLCVDNAVFVCAAEVATYLGCCTAVGACDHNSPGVLACLRTKNSSELEV